MGTYILLLILILLVAGGAWLYLRQRRQAEAAKLDDARADARRWVETLGGQVLNLSATNDASRQALADAGERYNAAGSQIDQARTPTQYQLATRTAMEGLYYSRAARTAMGLDPGPALPALPGQLGAGTVTDEREVEVNGEKISASPRASEENRYYYPGGRVAGRSVPGGWYNQPWWKPALIGGAWGLGSALLFSSLFSGMVGIPSAGAWEQGSDSGNDQGLDAGQDDSQDGGDAGSDGGDYGDSGDSSDSGDFGGDFGGGDFGGDFGGGDFGGDF